MKGAVVLILILLMGLFTAQSIEALGYDITEKDTIFLENIFATIEKKGYTGVNFEKNFTPYLTYFPSNSRQYKLLHEVYAYIKNRKTDISTTGSTKQSKYSQKMIRLLGEQF